AFFFFFSSRRRHTRFSRDWSSRRVLFRSVELAESAILHSDPQRFALLYRLLWRLQGTPRILDDRADLDVRRIDELARGVRRDMQIGRASCRERARISVRGGTAARTNGQVR